MSALAQQRRFFAEELETLCDIRTPALVDAFAAVPRERFLPPGPWTVRSEIDYLAGAPRRTPDADPRRVCHNVAVAVDPARRLFNGAPSLLALCLDRLNLAGGHRVLHVGCGTGYYSAVAAECVGPRGFVSAIEVDDGLAAEATRNLAAWPQARVERGDGASCEGPFDAILINAGVTHPQQAWLDALVPGGRMILPLTVSLPAMGTIGKGWLLRLTKGEADFAVDPLTPTVIYSALVIRDEALNARLGQSLMRAPRPAVTRLRRDPHDEAPSCWFHGPGFCFDAPRGDHGSAAQSEGIDS